MSIPNRNALPHAVTGYAFVVAARAISSALRMPPTMVPIFQDVWYEGAMTPIRQPPTELYNVTTVFTNAGIRATINTVVGGSNYELMDVDWFNGYHNATITTGSHRVSLTDAFYISDNGQQSTVTGESLPAGGDCLVNIGGDAHHWSRGIGESSHIFRLSSDQAGKEVAVMQRIGDLLCTTFSAEKEGDYAFTRHLLLAMVVLNRF